MGVGVSLFYGLLKGSLVFEMEEIVFFVIFGEVCLQFVEYLEVGYCYLVVNYKGLGMYLFQGWVGWWGLGGNCFK